MEKSVLVETMRSEFKILIEGAGLKVDEDFTKVFDDELKKKLDNDKTLHGSVQQFSP